VVAVTDDDEVRSAMERLGAAWTPDTADEDLNGAVLAAADRLLDVEPGQGFAVLVADLPALRGDELRRALRVAAGHDRAFAADSAGTGTTLLTARPGVALDPRFGPRSRAAHAASGAVPLEPGPVPGLRRDVDTEVDLWDAGRLGLGQATAALLGTEQ
jgi:2-phospho-L-lactate guanylyltransferase